MQKIKCSAKRVLTNYTNCLLPERLQWGYSSKVPFRHVFSLAVSRGGNENTVVRRPLKAWRLSIPFLHQQEETMRTVCPLIASANDSLTIGCHQCNLTNPLSLKQTTGNKKKSSMHSKSPTPVQHSMQKLVCEGMVETSVCRKQHASNIQMV